MKEGVSSCNFKRTSRWHRGTAIQESKSKSQMWQRRFSGHFCRAVPILPREMPSQKSSLFRKAPLNRHQQWNCTRATQADLIWFRFLPDKTVNFRASWAIMFTKPFSRESKALPSSIKYLDSQARQYCSLDCNMLLHGAVKLPEKGCKDGIHVQRKRTNSWLLARWVQQRIRKELAGHWNILIYCDNKESYLKLPWDLDSVFPLFYNKFGLCK